MKNELWTIKKMHQLPTATFYFYPVPNSELSGQIRKNEKRTKLPMM